MTIPGQASDAGVPPTGAATGLAPEHIESATVHESQHITIDGGLHERASIGVSRRIFLAMWCDAQRRMTPAS
jgi:hypothetical protein